LNPIPEIKWASFGQKTWPFLIKIHQNSEKQKGLNYSEKPDIYCFRYVRL